MTAAPYPDFDGTQVCAQTDPEAYFLEQGSLSVENLRAKALCADCPFLDPCLTYSLHYKVDGIWAGTTEFDRRKLRRKRGIRAIRLQTTLASERSDAALRMHARGTSTTEIARHLDVTVEAVNRILRGAA